MFERLFQRVRRMLPHADPDRHPFDRTHGLDTGGFIPTAQLKSGHPHDIHNVAYYATPSSLVEAMLNRWLQTPGHLPIEQYTFIDIGSGKGRVLLIASTLPFRKCIGIELNPELNSIAAANIAKWKQSGRPATPIETVRTDATEFEFPPGPCLLYLFNPFTAEVLARLLDRIARAFADRPGQLDLLYVNAEHRGLLDRHSGFIRLWEMPVTLSSEDAAADLLDSPDDSGSRPYSLASQDPCFAWRFTGNM